LEKTAQAVAGGFEAKKALKKKIKEKGKELIRDVFYPDPDAPRPERLPYHGG